MIYSIKMSQSAKKKNIKTVAVSDQMVFPLHQYDECLYILLVSGWKQSFKNTHLKCISMILNWTTTINVNYPNLFRTFFHCVFTQKLFNFDSILFTFTNGPSSYICLFVKISQQSKYKLEAVRTNNCCFIENWWIRLWICN